MNLRAMDAVFPIREKSVNLIKILNESSPKEEDEFRDIDAVEFTCWSFLFLVKRYKEFIRKKWQ